MKKKFDILNLVVYIAVCLSIAGFGSIFTINSIGPWYQNLNKPVFNPPNWAFSVVWIILYLMIAVSLTLIWENSKNKKNKQLYNIFIVQLLVNALWSPIFFGLRNALMGLVDIIILDILVAYIIIKAYPVSKTASLLLVPYLIWICFASVLNYYILILN
jgi:translocator protein